MAARVQIYTELLGSFFVASLYGGSFCLKLCIFGSFFGDFGFCFFGGFSLQLFFFGLSSYVMDSIYCVAVEIDTGHAGCLTGAVAHEAQIVAAYFTALGNLYLQYKRAVEQKALFYTHSTCNAAHGNSAGMAIFTASMDHQTLKNLHTLFIAFTDTLVDTNGVASAHISDCRLLERICD